MQDRPRSSESLFVRIGDSNRWTINFAHPAAPWAIAAVVLLIVVGVRTGFLKPRMTGWTPNPAAAPSAPQHP